MLEATEPATTALVSPWQSSSIVPTDQMPWQRRSALTDPVPEQPLLAHPWRPGLWTADPTGADPLAWQRRLALIDTQVNVDAWPGPASPWLVSVQVQVSAFAWYQVTTTAGSPIPNDPAPRARWQPGLPILGAVVSWLRPPVPDTPIPTALPVPVGPNAAALPAPTGGIIAWRRPNAAIESTVAEVTALCPASPWAVPLPEFLSWRQRPGLPAIAVECVTATHVSPTWWPTPPNQVAWLRRSVSAAAVAEVSVTWPCAAGLWPTPPIIVAGPWFVAAAEIYVAGPVAGDVVG